MSSSDSPSRHPSRRVDEVKLENGTTASGNFLYNGLGLWWLILGAKGQMNHGESFTKHQLPKIRSILMPFYILLALPLRGKSMIRSFKLKLHSLKRTAKCICQDCKQKLETRESVLTILCLDPTVLMALLDIRRGKAPVKIWNLSLNGRLDPCHQKTMLVYGNGSRGTVPTTNFGSDRKATTTENNKQQHVVLTS